MLLQFSPARKMLFGFLITAFAFSARRWPATALIQEPPDWKRGRELYEAQNFLAAVPCWKKQRRLRRRTYRFFRGSASPSTPFQLLKPTKHGSEKCSTVPAGIGKVPLTGRQQ